jgi:hypothetical protein
VGTGAVAFGLGCVTRVGGDGVAGFVAGLTGSIPGTVAQAVKVATMTVVRYKQRKCLENEDILRICPTLLQLSIGKGRKCRVQSAENTVQKIQCRVQGAERKNS